jgi:hypothetical protein
MLTKSLLSLVFSVFFLANLANAKPLAFVKQSGGFCHSQCPTTTITIHDNGLVVAEVETFVPASKLVKVTISQLSQRVIKAIKKDIELATAVALVDSKPEAPFCADIPLRSFNVIKGTQTIEIGAERDCHDFLLESYEATGIVTTLKGLVFLNNYSLKS